MMASRTNIGPVLPKMFRGCPPNKANRIPVTAAAKIHSITPYSHTDNHLNDIALANFFGIQFFKERSKAVFYTSIC
jgi:hypothetical protein